MNSDAAKKYYKKISTTFNSVNKNDDFAKLFLNFLKSAETKVYQKERKEKRIFDDEWLTSVKEIIPVIDKLTRNPRELLKKNSFVIAVERAKKVDADSIRHLAANTQLIRDKKVDGSVVPKEILTSNSEISLGTYENRFLKSLVDKLYRFIEIRYDLIVKKMHTEYVNHLSVQSAFEVEGTHVEYDINFRVHREIDSDELGRKNEELFKTIKEVRRAITIYKLSSFMKEMAEFPPVKPPILRTNIIMHNVDFQKCYNLWLLLDRVDFIGYDVDFYERSIKFDEEYLSQIENSILVMYATIASNQIDDFTFSKDIQFDYKRRRVPRIMTSNFNDEYLEPEIVRFKDNRINQYFLDQLRQITQTKYENLLASGVPDEESIKILYNQLVKIADEVLKDFAANKFRVSDDETIEEKYENQKQIVKIYRRIEALKRERIKEFSTEKAIQVLKYDNIKDEYQEYMEELRKLAEEEREQQKQAKLEEQKQEALDKLAKKRKIDQAQKILDEAEEKRKQKEADSVLEQMFFDVGEEKEEPSSKSKKAKKKAKAETAISEPEPEETENIVEQMSLDVDEEEVVSEAVPENPEPEESAEPESESEKEPEANDLDNLLEQMRLDVGDGDNEAVEEEPEIVIDDEENPEEKTTDAVQEELSLFSQQVEEDLLDDNEDQEPKSDPEADLEEDVELPKAKE